MSSTARESMRWNPTLLLAVAVGSGGLSYGAISIRGLLADGGPAALIAGTAAAVLVAFLAALLLRTRARTAPEPTDCQLARASSTLAA